MSDLNKIIEDLSKLTVVEAADLSKQLEENGELLQQLQQHQQQLEQQRAQKKI